MHGAAHACIGVVLEQGQDSRTRHERLQAAHAAWAALLLLLQGRHPRRVWQSTAARPAPGRTQSPMQLTRIGFEIDVRTQTNAGHPVVAMPWDGWPGSGTSRMPIAVPWSAAVIIVKLAITSSRSTICYRASLLLGSWTFAWGTASLFAQSGASCRTQFFKVMLYRRQQHCNESMG